MTTHSIRQSELNSIYPDLYLDAAVVFENPCFDGTSDSLTDQPKLKLAFKPRSPTTRLATDVPVIAPKRRASYLFPNYLRRQDNVTAHQNNQNMFREQEVEKESNNNKGADDVMNAHSTRCLQPYDGINLHLDEQPRIENYISNINSEDFTNFSSALNKEVKEARITDFVPPYFKLNMEKGINISSVKFGWFEGVFIRTSVNLLGVMLFMRMGWMSAQCGMLIALLQILIATIITSLTTLSMNALCTNGDIGAGGIYSLVARSLGPEAGANIGIIFGLTNAAFVGLNIIGAADAIIQIFNHFSINIFDNPLNDIRFIGVICLILIALIPIISLELEAKTQTFFFVLILICIFDYFIGALIPPNDEQRRRGFHGFHLYVAEGNLYPKW